jgi:hypothetical protein
MTSISQKLWQLIKATLIVIFFGPLVLGFFYILLGGLSISNTSTNAIEMAEEIQADFNGQYPETLAGYKDWKADESHYGYASAKTINSMITDTIMYKPLNNGESFELAYIHMVDIYRFGPVDGEIQSLPR